MSILCLYDFDFFKLDGKETKISHLLFHRIWKNQLITVLFCFNKNFMKRFLPKFCWFSIQSVSYFLELTLSLESSLINFIISGNLSKIVNLYDKAIPLADNELEMEKFCIRKQLAALQIKLNEKAIPGSNLFRNLRLEIIKNKFIKFLSSNFN